MRTDPFGADGRHDAAPSVRAAISSLCPEGSFRRIGESPERMLLDTVVIEEVSSQTWSCVLTVDPVRVAPGLTLSRVTGRIGLSAS